jgi:hypothetical protein
MDATWEQFVEDMNIRYITMAHFILCVCNMQIEYLTFGGYGSYNYDSTITLVKAPHL